MPSHGVYITTTNRLMNMLDARPFRGVRRFHLEMTMQPREQFKGLPHYGNGSELNRFVWRAFDVS